MSATPAPTTTGRNRWLSVRKLSPVLVLAGLALASSRTALAEGGQSSVVGGEIEQQGLTPPNSQPWNVTLGIGLAAEPDYPGARRYRPSPLPMVSITYRNFLFLGPGGIGINAINWHGLRAGPILGFGFGRKQSDDPHLNGLGDIQPSVNAGAFAAYRFGPFELNGTVRQAVTHTRYGLTGSASFNYMRPLIAKKLALALGPEIDLANSDYAQTWFGVSSAQSAKSGLPAYTASGGVKDVGFHAILTYRYSEHILFRAFGDVRQFTGSVAASPIVQSKTQAVIGFGVAYHF